MDSDARLNIAYIGNFEPTYSTENEYAHAFEQLGHQVDRYQEGHQPALNQLIDVLIVDPAFVDRPDFILWTRTKSLSEQWDQQTLWAMLRLAGRRHVPVVGVHLDRWWGLDRQSDLLGSPYFRGVDLLFTADGAHQAEWEEIGVNHRWLLPGISERWCQPGQHRDEYDCDVVFVGGWRDYGHREWKHRAELINHLSRRFGDRFLALPRPNQPAIRGLELNDVYWSAKVVVGDSCLVPKVDGTPMTHYCSDRIPETLGRGGILVHPIVEGVFGMGEPLFGPGAWAWQLGNFRALDWVLDTALDEEYEPSRRSSIDVIRANHTYTVRAGQILDAMREESLL